MNGSHNWSARGQPTHGDGGANAARFPTSRTGGGADISAAGTTRASRGGVDNNSMPSFSGTSSTLSTNNSASNGASASMNHSRASTPSSDRGVDGAFDSKYISRGTAGLTFGDAPLWNDVMSGKALSEAPQQRADRASRRDSFASNTTFATQLPPPAAFQGPPGQNNARPNLNMRNMNSMPRHDGQYARGNGPQFRNGIDTSINGISAGMGHIRVTDNGSPSRQPHGHEGMIPSYGIQGAFNGGRGAPYHMGNEFYPGSQQEGRSKFFADMIKRGQTEDPYDRNMSRYDTPSRMQNPTLGPARFKDSKVFATVADTAPHGASSPAAMQMPMRDVVPMDKKKRPDWLELAVQGLMTPSLEEAFDALPLTELCRSYTNNLAGVIRIKDIPYSTTRQEMTAFIGRNAQVLRQPQGSPYHSVHILMERESGKTQDCFIEVTNPSEAAWVARQFGRRVDQKRPPKVGDRCVEVLYSSQDELMVELFPRAKHVRWSNGQPVVDRSERKYYADRPAAGFQGFLHPEELIAMSKHANLSERSPYANKSPCRVYESMITLLHKYPWNYVDEITIAERRAIFDCAVGLIKTLILDIRRMSNKDKFSLQRPTPALLQELAAAALVCPGFTEKQMAIVVETLIQGGYKSMSDGRDLNITLGGRHPYSAFWPFSALGMPPDTDQEVLQYFASLFRRGTASNKGTSLAARKAAESAGHQENPMGNWNINYGPNASTLSLAQVGKIEFDEIERVLTLICSQRPRSPAVAPHNHAGAPGLLVQGSASGPTSSSSSGTNRQNSGNGNLPLPSFY